jgi:hypothetical protein
MTEFWEADLAGMFVDFGIDATYGASTIQVIFDNEFLAASAFDIEVESREPKCYVKESDVSGIDQGDTLVINSTTYYVIKVEPDGTGLTRLILSKDS